MLSNWVTSVGLTVVACIPLGLALQTSDNGLPQERNTTTIDRAVDYIVTKGEEWIKERKCVSCHMIPFTVWSLNEANASGHKLPMERYRSLTKWTIDDAKRLSPGAEGLALLIVARGNAGSAKSDETSFRIFAEKLLGMQRADGSWAPGGQTPQQKRPLTESKEVVTMWAMLALDETLGSQAKDAIRKGRISIADSGATLSNEWTVTRLLTAIRFGEGAIAKKQTDQLLKSQKKDGGWGWINGGESDAIATGQSLYALSFVQSKQSREAIAAGRRFLESTQSADGSWEVKGTLAQHKTQVMPTSVYWGTTWAVIGLCRTQ